MSEEAAFLEALKANPADDTARLVYADWLDEHGEPAKAEYLRLVATLAQTEQDYAPDQPEVTRLLTVIAEVPHVWRVASGRRFKVQFLGSTLAAKKIETIMVMRVLNGYGLAEAKSLYEQPPSTIFSCVPFEQGFATRDYLQAISGGQVRLSPSDKPKHPDTTSYTIFARQRDHGREARSQFEAFLQAALSLSAAESRKTARSVDDILITGELEAYLAFSRLSELQRLVSSERNIWIYPQPVQSPPG